MISHWRSCMTAQYRGKKYYVCLSYFVSCEIGNWIWTVALGHSFYFIEVSIQTKQNNRSHHLIYFFQWCSNPHASHHHPYIPKICDILDHSFLSRSSFVPLGQLQFFLVLHVGKMIFIIWHRIFLFVLLFFL